MAHVTFALTAGLESVLLQIMPFNWGERERERERNVISLDC